MSPIGMCPIVECECNGPFTRIKYRSNELNFNTLHVYTCFSESNSYQNENVTIKYLILNSNYDR